MTGYVALNPVQVEQKLRQCVTDLYDAEKQQCKEWWEHYRLSQTRCQAAQDHVRTVRDVASAVQSIASLVRQAYSMAGQS